MFVSIDMDALRFLHKHHDHETISAISWLECGQHVSIRVEPCADNSRFLQGVSDLDVRMLYKNSTGKELPRDAHTAALRYQLAHMVQLLPHTRCLTDEVLAQVETVDDRLYAGERFKYAFGSKTPAQPIELFPLTTRPLTDQELATAASHSRMPVQGYPPRLSGQQRKPWEPEVPVASAPPAAPQTTAPAVAAPVEPKRAKAATGSVRPVARAAAEKAWAERAPGTTWKQVRDEILTRLTDEGYHPTTIRIKLSEWAKENSL